jgi:GT2 family glycosyltransferase
LEDTLQCVESIRRIDYPALKLLVIDNASPDGGGAELARKIPREEFLQLPHNIGYAGGNNAGISMALREGAAYVLIVNPDVRLSADCLRNYVRIFASDGSIGALNSIQLGGDERTIDRAFLQGILAPAGYPSPVFHEENYPEIIEARTLFGAALMISADTLRRVGGFDPLYFAYGEEVDLCQRMMFHGFRLILTRHSPVIHLRTNYTRPLSDFVLFLKLKGYYLVWLKNPYQPLHRSARKVVRTLWAAYRGRAQDEYPFNTHSIRRALVGQAAWWFVLHAYQVWRHRRSEMAGRAHI